MKCLILDCKEQATQGFKCCNRTHGYELKVWKEIISGMVDPNFKISKYLDPEPDRKDPNLNEPIESFVYYYQVLTN